ncbi:MAG: EF-hand domain-containing protein [Rubrivivax sp.]|nr:EF-hand domain-containing protein [Rubrivivax sp.]
MRTGMMVWMGVVLLLGAAAPGAMAGPPEANVRQAYRMLLAEADKNKDGKLSMAECTPIFKTAQMAQQKCGFWDVNKDGTITEEEYVQQVARITSKKR